MNCRPVRLWLLYSQGLFKEFSIWFSLLEVLYILSSKWNEIIYIKFPIFTREVTSLLCPSQMMEVQGLTLALGLLLILCQSLSLDTAILIQQEMLRIVLFIFTKGQPSTAEEWELWGWILLCQRSEPKTGPGFKLMIEFTRLLH